MTCDEETDLYEGWLLLLLLQIHAYPFDGFEEVLQLFVTSWNGFCISLAQTWETVALLGADAHPSLSLVAATLWRKTVSLYGRI